MPIREYKCNDCRAITETVCYDDVPPETFKCSRCGGVAKRIFSAPSFIGWERSELNQFTYNPERGEQDVEYDLRYAEKISGTGRFETPGSNPDPRGKPLKEYFRKGLDK